MRIFNWLVRLTDALSGRPRKRRSFFLSDTEQFESRAMLSAIFVTTPIDASDALVGDGQALTTAGETSLRSAVQEANENPGLDTIHLPAGIFSLDLLETIDNETSGADLDVTDDLSIRGSGPDATIIDATGIDQLFELSNGAELDLHDLTIRIPDLANVIDDVSGLAPLDNVALIEVDGALESDAAVEEDSASNDDEGGTSTDQNDVAVGVAIPIRGFAPLSQNPRQIELVQTLAVPGQIDSWEFFSTATLGSNSSDIQPDATLGIGSRSNNQIALKPQERPDVATNSKKSPHPSAEGVGLITKQNPSDSTAQRRSDVVNSLFEKPSHEKQRVLPAGAQETETTPGQPAAKDVSKRLDPTPALLPQVDTPAPDLKPNAVFPIEQLDRPAPPPLPESLDDHTSIPARRPARRTSALAVGVLVAAVGPKGWQRVWTKLSKRSRRQSH